MAKRRPGRPTLADLRTQQRNANGHTPRGMAALLDSIQGDGWIGALTVAADGEAIAGSARLEMAAAVFGPDVEPIVVDSDGTRPIVVRRTDLANAGDPKAARLAIADNRVAEVNLKWDPSVLAGAAAADAAVAAMWDANQLVAAAENHEGPAAGALPPPPAAALAPSTPDMLWPSDNEFGVPVLDLTMQAEGVVAPVLHWGVQGKKREFRGTWHFYTDDHRFNALWRDPSAVCQTMATALVEPNFSVSAQFPRAVAIWQTYRKRWMARFWQSKGLRVFVDLNVPQDHMDINLLGVPAGWRAFATRGYVSRPEDTEAEYETACRIRGSQDVLFLVVGGAAGVGQLCRQRGWLWIPEHMDTVQRKGGALLDL